MAGSLKNKDTLVYVEASQQWDLPIKSEGCDHFCCDMVNNMPRGAQMKGV